MQYITDIISTIVVFGTAVIAVIALLNFILKLRILHSGSKDETYIKLLSGTFDYKASALKWGLLLLSGGIGLILISFLPAAQNFDSPLPYGIEAVFLAAGFLAYYLIVKKE